MEKKKKKVWLTQSRGSTQIKKEIWMNVSRRERAVISEVRAETRTERDPEDSYPTTGPIQ